jgi:hypothetical protein
MPEVAVLRQLPQGAVLGLEVMDPRLSARLKRAGDISGRSSTSCATWVPQTAATAAAASGGVQTVTGGPGTLAFHPGAAAGPGANQQPAQGPTSADLQQQLLRGVQDGSWVAPAQQLLQAPATCWSAAPQVLVGCYRGQQRLLSLGLSQPLGATGPAALAGRAVAGNGAGRANRGPAAHVQHQENAQERTELLPGLVVSPYGITARLHLEQQQQQQQALEEVGAVAGTTTTGIAHASSSSSSGGGSSGGSSGMPSLPCGSTVPLLLIRQQACTGAADTWRHSPAAPAGGLAVGWGGWSLVVPATWALPFWEAAAAAGEVQQPLGSSSNTYGDRAQRLGGCCLQPTGWVCRRWCNLQVAMTAECLWFHPHGVPAALPLHMCLQHKQRSIHCIKWYRL